MHSGESRGLETLLTRSDGVGMWRQGASFPISEDGRQMWTHTLQSPATQWPPQPLRSLPLCHSLSLAPAGAFCRGGTAIGRRDTSRKTLRALTSIFAASVHASWPWPFGKVHRSNSCCRHLMAGNKIASKLPPPWSCRVEKEPPGSAFLLAFNHYRGGVPPVRVTDWPACCVCPELFRPPILCRNLLG